MPTRLVAAAIVLATLATAARAEVKLPSLLSDNMVVQQGRAAMFWGTAAPGEKVTVTFAAETASTTAGQDGRWRVALQPPASGGPYQVQVAGANTITIRNVLVGEVWLCGGQSNMELSLNQAVNGTAEAAAADFPQIRQFRIPMTPSGEPQTDCPGSWVVCSPATAGRFTAVGYFFGRAIHKDLKAPVGLINNSVGATFIGTWLDPAIVAGESEFKVAITRYQQAKAEYGQARSDYGAALASYEAARAGLTDQAALRKPEVPTDPLLYMPGVFYNGMVVPLRPFPIAGVVWYQGESNAVNAGYQVYGRLLTALIRNYRRDWGREDLPFLVVQLPGCGPATTDPNGWGGWMAVQEGQLYAASLPKVGLAVTIDLGDGENIHPQRKKEVGERLALAALAIAYDKKVSFSGPIFQSATVEGNKVRLKFNHAESGLEARGGELKGYAIAGADRKFVWAQAGIDGRDVIVTSSLVAAPLAVRYGCSMLPECNLYNQDGLPAAPFRTDGWSTQAPRKSHHLRTTLLASGATAIFIAFIIALKVRSNRRAAGKRT